MWATYRGSVKSNDGVQGRYTGAHAHFTVSELKFIFCNTAMYSC